MFKRILVFAFFAAFAVQAFPQNLTTVSGSNITDINGTKLAAGQVCFLITDQSDNPISVSIGGGGQALKRGYCSAVTAGVVTGFTVPNPANTSPTGIYYRVTVKDSSTGQEVLRYTLVSFTGATFNFDNYAPTNLAQGAPLTGTTVSGNLSGNGNATFTGTVTGSNIPAGQLDTGTGTTNKLPKFTTGASGIVGDSSITDNGTTVSTPENFSAGGTLGGRRIDTLSDCSNSAFANTAACQTDASTTGGMFFPPNYSIGAFTNSSNRPVLDITKVDWRGFVNVKDFGAKGDGSTDDTTAIQAAINFVCTGSSTTVPTANLCPNAVSGNAVGGTVYIPAGDYHYSSPILVYGGITLRGAGKLATKLTKTTNTVGTGSITAGTGVGRTSTSCSGGTCVDSFAVDSLISVPYISSGNTDYAYRWTIRDLALYGSGTNGTKYGIYAPRASQSVMKDLYIFMNCSQGAPANCGSVQGSGFWTEDSWLMRHEGVTIDSSWIGWNHVNDGSSLGAGTSTIFGDDWGVNIGCSGFHLFGLSYSNMNANAIDHFNKKGTDLVASDGTCYPFSFSSTSGMSINGGGAEDVIGGIMWASASSVTISGGFKTFTQVGQTSGATLATVFIDGGSAVTMNGTLFSAVTSPGNIFNIVLQGSSFLNDTNSTLPTGGNGFIGYAGTSAKCDFNIGVLTCTNGSGNNSFDSNKLSIGETTAPSAVASKAVCYADSTAHTLKCAYNNGSFFSVPQTIASGTAAMTTAGIATGACGSTVTVAGTGILTTDTIVFARNAAVTIGNGGGLTLNAWPTAGNVNFNYCNSAAGTITPTAMTINWSVRRP